MSEFVFNPKTHRYYLDGKQPVSTMMPVVGYEGLYSVSFLGAVWSHAQSKYTKSKWLKPSDRKGYKSVMLFKNGKATRHSIHRLVATAFIPNPEKLPQLNHKDGNKLNNFMGNLEWCSSKNNTHHAIKNGMRETVVASRRGEKSNWAKYDKHQIMSMRALYKAGHTQKQIASMYGSIQAYISDVVNRKVWKHI